MDEFEIFEKLEHFFQNFRFSGKFSMKYFGFAVFNDALRKKLKR